MDSLKLKSLICLIKFVGVVEGGELYGNVRLDVGLEVDMKNQACLGTNKLFCEHQSLATV